MRSPRSLVSRSIGRVLAAAGQDDGERTLQVEREDLVARRDRLVSRIITAKAASDAAASRVREILTASEIDDHAHARAERARSEAGGTLAGVEDAHGELVERLAALDRLIAERRDQAERKRVIDLRRAAMARIETGAAKLDAAARAYRDDRAAFLRDHAADVPLDHHGWPRVSGLVVCADRLSGAVLVGEDDPMKSAADAARPILAEMAAEIAAIEGGAAPATEPKTSVVPAPILVLINDVRVVLSRPVQYLTESGWVRTVSGEQDLPAPAADAAKAAGVAFDLGSADAHGIMVVLAEPTSSNFTILERREGGPWTPARNRKGGEPSLAPGDQWMQLDFDLSRWVEQERDRLTKAAA